MGISRETDGGAGSEAILHGDVTRGAVTGRSFRLIGSRLEVLGIWMSGSA